MTFIIVIIIIMLTWSGNMWTYCTCPNGVRQYDETGTIYSHITGSRHLYYIITVYVMFLLHLLSLLGTVCHLWFFPYCLHCVSSIVLFVILLLLSAFCSFSHTLAFLPFRCGYAVTKPVFMVLYENGFILWSHDRPLDSQFIFVISFFLNNKWNN